MAAPTNAANVKKALANSEPSTHGTSKRFTVRAARGAGKPSVPRVCLAGMPKKREYGASSGAIWGIPDKDVHDKAGSSAALIRGFSIWGVPRLP